MFHLTGTDQQSALEVVQAPESKVVISAVSRLEPLEKASGIRIIRKTGSAFTPSIKDALAGMVSEKKEEDQVSESVSIPYDDYAESFTSEQLAAKWAEFIDQLTDRPNLRSTLSNVPEITEGNQLILKIGNSVQEEEIRLVKYELISWLRRELRNSGIELTTRIEKIEQERMFYSDSEKLQMMMQKNPELYELKQKFNLDFKD